MLLLLQEIDKDRSGKIDKKEFKAALEKMGIEGVSLKVCKAVMKSVDPNGDGELEYKEILPLLKAPRNKKQPKEDEKTTTKKKGPPPTRRLSTTKLEGCDLGRAESTEQAVALIWNRMHAYMEEKGNTRVKELFLEIDKDSSGTIDLAELERALGRMNITGCSEDMLKAFVKKTVETHAVAEEEEVGADPLKKAKIQKKKRLSQKPTYTELEYKHLLAVIKETKTDFKETGLLTGFQFQAAKVSEEAPAQAAAAAAVAAAEEETTTMENEEGGEEKEAAEEETTTMENEEGGEEIEEKEKKEETPSEPDAPTTMASEDVLVEAAAATAAAVPDEDAVEEGIDPPLSEEQEQPPEATTAAAAASHVSESTPAAASVAAAEALPPFLLLPVDGIFTVTFLGPACVLNYLLPGVVVRHKTSAPVTKSNHNNSDGGGGGDNDNDDNNSKVSSPGAGSGEAGLVTEFSAHACGGCVPIGGCCFGLLPLLPCAGLCGCVAPLRFAPRFHRQQVINGEAAEGSGKSGHFRAVYQGMGDVYANGLVNAYCDFWYACAAASCSNKGHVVVLKFESEGHNADAFACYSSSSPCPCSSNSSGATPLLVGHLAPTLNVPAMPTEMPAAPGRMEM